MKLRWIDMMSCWFGVALAIAPKPSLNSRAQPAEKRFTNVQRSLCQNWARVPNATRRIGFWFFLLRCLCRKSSLQFCRSDHGQSSRNTKYNSSSSLDASWAPFGDASDSIDIITSVFGGIRCDKQSRSLSTTSPTWSKSTSILGRRWSCRWVCLAQSAR